jgi:hypothetical protein
MTHGARIFDPDARASAQRWIELSELDGNDGGVAATCSNNALGERVPPSTFHVASVSGFQSFALKRIFEAGCVIWFVSA